MTRVFSASDQDTFARVSGDYNPIHVDAIAARRLLFGRPVVHGIHALLWAIDSWLEGRLSRIRIQHLKVSFRGAVIVNESVELVIRSVGSNETRLDIVGNEAKLLSAKLTTELDADYSGTSIPVEIPTRSACRDLNAADLQAASGRLPLCLDPQAASSLFPNVVRLIPVEQVAMLLATTRLVGMEAPGLHSVYVGLDLTHSGSEKDPALIYQVDSYDERFSMLTLRVAGPGLRGQVSATVRPAPAGQPGLAEIQALVGTDEFRGERALVIGGSRGLGEVAVKILAAGGADVKFSYYKGLGDAERVASEVTAHGCAAAYFAYDVIRDAPDLPSLVHQWAPTVLCYFATPFIAPGTPGRFSIKRFQQFCDCYVTGFLETFLAAKKIGGDMRRVLYPSSAFVKELPANLGEYCAAKSAAETLCHFLEKTHQGLQIYCPRLPPLATDQTAGLSPMDKSLPLTIMFETLREMWKIRNASL